MSKVHEYEKLDEEEPIELTGEEAEELDAAIAEADAHPDDRIELGELMRRLRNGE